MYFLIQLYLSKIPFFFGAPPRGGYVNCNQDKQDAFFFGLPKWYRYLPYNANPYTGRCEIVISGNGLSSNYWLIGMAILDMLLRIAGMVAMVFVIWGGFTYLTSLGEPEKLAEARRTIINALIGAVIAIIAASVVGFVGNRLGGS
jgi:hypothetical protein